MSQDSFTHLHVASALSMRFGTSEPHDLVARAVEHGQSILALTDRDTVSGAVRFVRSCASAGIAPVLGVDIALSEPYVPQLTPAHGGAWLRRDHPRVTLLASDKNSWAGLCAIISRAHHSVRSEPTIDHIELMELAGRHGLVVLLGPRSDIGQFIAQRRPDRALDVVQQWQAHGVNPYIEIATHMQSPDGMNLSDTYAARMLQWAIAHRTSAVLTNMVRYVDPRQSRVADVLDSSRLQVALNARNRGGSTDQAFLASTKHMVQIAQRISSMVGDPRDIAKVLLANTRSVGEKCVIDSDRDLGMNSVYVPELSVLLPEERRSADAVLRERCMVNLDRYLAETPESKTVVRERFESELHVIERMGFAGYLLTVAEVVDMVRAMGIRIAARGSGAGSFLNYLLGISGVDPVRHNLLMERFVSTLRPGLPDIDVDVESARRLEIYDAIFAKFGNERTTCVSMRETYRVRHAIRDVGAALGMPRSEVGIFAKSFPHIRARHVRSALAELPELRRSGIGKMAASGQLNQFLELVEGLDGLPRNIAMHPCGVVLSDSTLLSRTPVQPSAQGYSMSQFDKDDVEHMGLLKLDVLGVRMQSALAYAVDEVERVVGAQAHGADGSGRVDLESVPHDDPATFALIQSTRVLGCFQIESPGQRELIGKFAPETFGDLITDISLFRPGPVKSDMISPFLRARQGWGATDYIHPDLEPALAETHGVVVYHEQVMRIITVMTGCTLEYADLIRRRMGDREQLDEIRHWFYQCAGKRRYALTVIEEAWNVLRAFASFGFCKAHAAAFALPTYQSAWFKAHHPAAFLAGVLTHDPGMYPKRLIIDDARAFGIDVLGLDVNASGEFYRVECAPAEQGGNRYGIRIPFTELKGINSDEVVGAMAGQPYRSLADFVTRSHVSRPTLERIVLAGGFDQMYGSREFRRDLLFHVSELATNMRLRNSRRSAVSNQMLISADVDDWQLTSTGLPPMTLAECVRHEVEILGIDVSAHVMSFYGDMLRELGVVPAEKLLELRSHGRIFVAGVKVATQTPPIRSGRRVAFVTLDDASGPVDATFFEEAQDAFAPTLFHSWLLLVSGTVRRTGPRGVSVLADGCWALSDVYQQWKVGGVQAVNDFVNADRRNHAETDDRVAPTQIWEHASGFRQSPFADVRPAGADMSRGMRSASIMAP